MIIKDRWVKENLKLYIYWAIVVLYLIMIFCFSSQNGEKSREVSSGILYYISFFALLFPERLVDFFHGLFGNHELILRKAAHFTEYLILSLIFFRALSLSGVKGKKSYAITLAFCFLYAISDEIHQIFVPGRAFAIKDIFIDTCGAALGLSIIALNKILGKKRKQKHSVGDV